MALFTQDALAGRVALVTGASRGIGQAVATALAEAGAYVVGTATTQAGADGISERLGAAGHGVVLNVNDAEASKTLVDSLVTAHGKLDILVNNAGITRDMLAMRLSDESWEAVLDTNLTAAFRLCRAVLRPMMKARFGRIVNISSVVGVTGNGGQANYAAAKAGLIAMSRSIAREVSSRGITVNCVAPGFIDTAMTQAIPVEAQEQLLKQIPAQKLGRPEDIASAVVFLASGGADYITGTVLHVNGGLFMG